MPLVGACPSQVPLYMLVGMRPKCTSPNNLLGECQKWAGIRLGENTPPPGDSGRAPQCWGPADVSALFWSPPAALWVDGVRANPHLSDMASHVGGLRPLVPQKNVGRKEPPS